MTIALRDIWAIEDIRKYKLHFARYNKIDQPLEVWARSKREWQEWQEYFPGRDDFNREFIFSLIQFYHEPDIWLFGGVFRVKGRTEKCYEVELTDIGQGFTGRLKLRSPYRKRSTRVNLENHYDEFEVQEVLREPYSGRSFPGYDDISISFDELEALVRNARPDWKAALESMKGIYLITDRKTGKRYVGAAYGGEGIWSRWCDYASTGHGGTVELRKLGSDLKYYRANISFALLEHRQFRTPDDAIRRRETFWKRILLTRGDYGYNLN